MLRGLLVNKPVQRRSQGLAGHLANTFGIGRIDQRDRGYVIYSSADFERAKTALRNGGISPAAPTPVPTPVPVKQADKGVVAVVPINMSGLQLPGARCATLAGRAALALDYQVILACEKFEMFLCLDEFSWLENFIRSRRTLALFVGSFGPYRKQVAQNLIEQSTAPVLAFFDFDPRGLQRAAIIPRLEALCLPEWQDLEQALWQKKQSSVFQRELVQHRPHLDAVECEVIAPAWARMKHLQRGLELDAFPR